MPLILLDFHPFFAPLQIFSPILHIQLNGINSTTLYIITISTRMTLYPLFTLLLLLLPTSLAMDQFDSSVRVTYGSIVKVTNPSTNLILHSHDVFFGRGGVLSVTGFPVDDLGSYWQIGQPYQTAKKTYKDPVLCGDAITISSVIIGYFLRVQDTQFGLTTELLPMVHGMTKDKIDQKIDWKIQCADKEPGAEINYNDKIRFKHQVTGKHASMDSAYAYTEANCGRGCSIAGQIELHALDNVDDTTTVFQIKSGLAFDPLFVSPGQSSPQ